MMAMFKVTTTYLYGHMYMYIVYGDAEVVENGTRRTTLLYVCVCVCV